MILRPMAPGKISRGSLRVLGRILFWLVLSGLAFAAHSIDPARTSGTGLIGTLAVLGTTIGLGWMAEMGGWNGKILIPLAMAFDLVTLAVVGVFSGQSNGVIVLTTFLGLLCQAGAWFFLHQKFQWDHLERISRHRVKNARWEVRNIADNIRSGLLTVDCQGTVRRVNPSCCRILQMEKDDLLGRQLVDICQGGMEQFAQAIRGVAQGGEPLDRVEVQVEHLGRAIPVGMNVNHVTAPDGQIMGAIAIFTDLTREKEMSKRVRDSDRLAAIGELAASIAHEIRNPLASIRGSVEMLADDLDLAGDQAELLALVLKESGRVNTIINDFLAYSRVRPTSRRRFSGLEFRDEISLQIRQHVAAKNGNIRLHCDLQPEDLDVVADPGQLTQMTLNLVINACEAMKYEGDLRLSLRLLAAGTSQELVVSDNGPGVDEGIKEDLFTPFATTKETGTGLGLSIVQRIANAHGGDVRVETTPGGGTTFRVRWPVVHVDQDPRPAPDVRVGQPVCI